MKPAKDIGLILLLVILWFGSAYYAGEALLTGWGVQCGLASLIAGLLGIAIINRTEVGVRLLYEGKSDSEEISCLKLIVWLLIAVPFTLLFLGTVWWLMRLLGVFDFK